MAHDLLKIIPAPRLKRYRDIAGDGPGLKEFYLWAQDLSAALFSDIAGLEVIMRSAMARELASEFGPRWYTREDLFEDRAAGMLVRAWNDSGLEKLKKNGVSEPVLEGKLVASLMFGFWTQLLSSGGKVERSAVVKERKYDWLLWQPALSKAFPTAPNRSLLKSDADVVRHARNRVAHHEHIAWGVPLPGQKRTLSVTDVHQTVLRLAGYVDLDAAAWLGSCSRVETAVSECPVSAESLML